jgi:para-aminobenzoate synthetase/4-amino-4-deoxychorismate lyase
MGVGSGIVYDSGPAQEFEECGVKAKFLVAGGGAFELLETIAWNGRYMFLREHLRRMGDSARYFNFVFDREKIISTLQSNQKRFKNGTTYRVRLVLGKDGRLRVTHTPVSSQAVAEKENYFAFSGKRTDPRDAFLYHKTTRRDLYDSEYARYRARGYFDVVFLNTRGEVTEGAISNIIIEVRGRYYTPAVSSGLLPGIMRSHFIKNHRVKEKKLYLSDLRSAGKIFLCNSVRGVTQVRLT